VDNYVSDVVGIAKEMGAKVLKYDFEGKIDGVIVRISGRPYVGIDRRLDYVDARFTVAHELGHLEDGTVGMAYTLIAERRADKLARERLIPERDLFRAIGDYGGDAEFLACLFGVSKWVMEKRIKDIFLK